MKNKTVLAVAIIALVALGIYVITRIARPERPVVAENGRVSGVYSLESIMSLGEPYRCAFDLSGQASVAAGTMFTNGKDAYGEFRIRTDLLEDEFNSYLILRDRDAYIWTSLYPFGYKARAASSATRGATPVEQAQIIGKKDKIQYDCEPWQNADDSTFEPPTWIEFTELK